MTPHDRGQDPPYGWVVVAAAALCMAFGSASLLTLSVFLKPLVAEFGWLRGEVSFAYLVGTVAMGLGGIAMGWLADRVPVRWIVLTAGVAIGASFALLARADALWQLYLLHVILGGIGAAGCFAPIITIAGNWFEKRKGLALGLTTAGQSLGYALVPFLARHLITTLGWRETYTTLAVLTAAVVGLLALLLRDPPGFGDRRRAAATAVPGTAAGPVPMPFGHSVAWLGAAALFSMTLIGAGTVHVVALVQDLGLPPQSAAGVLTLVMLGAMVGRIALGRLADRLGGPRTVLVAALGQTLTVYWFVELHTLPALYVLGACFGLFQGAVMTCYMVCIRELVPLHRQGTAVGIVALFGWIGIGFGGWQGGALFDLSGDYRLSYLVAALAGAVNVAILAALWLRLSRGTVQPAPEAA